MDKSDSYRSVRSLRGRLTRFRRELHECEIGWGKVLLVPREWVKEALETRLYELENRIIIRIGVGEEKK